MKHTEFYVRPAAWGLLLAILLSMCLCPLQAVAQEKKEELLLPDPGKTGSITIEMKYDGAPVIGGTLEVYQAGYIEIYKDGDGNTRFGLRKTENFNSFGEELDNVQSAELAQELAEEMAQFVQQQNLYADYSAHNEAGNVVFGQLPAGLYLIIQSEASDGYEAMSPSLVSIPMPEDGAYVYNVNVHGKLSPQKSPQTPPANPDKSESEPEPNPAKADETTPASAAPENRDCEREKLPQTGQQNWPVPVLAVCGAAFFISGMLLKVDRSGESQEEHENDQE